LTRLLCQFIKARSARVFILDPEKKKVVMVAIFNNKINILLEKKKDLEGLSRKERRMMDGYTVVEPWTLGLPLVADDNIGAISVARGRQDSPFTDFDRMMLSVFAEQSVTAIKNLQLYEQQQNTILEIIRFIGKLLEKHGHGETSHTPVYFNICKCLAEKMQMGQEGINCLYYASVLHDAGAMNIPYEVLAKKSQLTPEEFKVIRDLPARSVELIRPVAFLRPVLPIILYHHEKYDGTGYPSGLRKEQIPLGARIMSVVDAFEAMIKGRPYKSKLTITEALGELRKNSGSQFDPKVIKSFCELTSDKKFKFYLSKMK
jgi:HD-GYP domain-containing protein (c-di-GMP phosphodiesterase class II)